MTISVIGAGAFGTALAISLAQTGRHVTLWARNKEHANDMRLKGENVVRLPGCPFPENLSVTHQIGKALSDHMLLAVPMQQLRGLLNTHLSDQTRTLVACCKGIELSTGLGPVAVIQDMVPNAVPAVLTGPSFAADIAKGLPTALTLACENLDIGAALQKELMTPNLRIYRTDDTKGAELGGALKNVMAIACGAVIGAGLGDSARAALMTRGYAEMKRMAGRIGARAETLSGLSGFGDLTLTCTSDLSRNYRFGIALGGGGVIGFDPSITVEGAATARATLQKAQELGIDMPITQAVVALLKKKMQVGDIVEMLLSRPPKEE